MARDEFMMQSRRCLAHRDDECQIEEQLEA
jgi:hypothetical protein